MRFVTGVTGLDHVDVSPLRAFVKDFAALLAGNPQQPAILAGGRVLLARLVGQDGWLPEAYARSDPDRYLQYLLHCDSRERFSVVSFVWGPNQATPIHDHRVWGLVGVLRGVERVERFRRGEGGFVADGPDVQLRAGDVDVFGPPDGDVHRVSNGNGDHTSVSIHVYGANIGTVERATYSADGTARAFISGYANSAIPNIWTGSPAS